LRTKLGSIHSEWICVMALMNAWPLVVVAACSHHAAPPAAPDYRPVATSPAPAQAALYAGCLASAAASGHVAHARDPGTSLLVFTCDGEPARAFYDGLASWSARIGSEFHFEGRTYRSTTRVRHDLFGVDYCATDGTRYECVVTLNVGEFVP
jgi:hypothetical protein